MSVATYIACRAPPTLRRGSAPQHCGMHPRDKRRSVPGVPGPRGKALKLTRPRRGLRWLVLLLLLLLALVVADLAGWPLPNRMLGARLGEHLGAQASLSGARLHLIDGPRLRLDALQLAQGERRLALRQLELRWTWADLWQAARAQAAPDLESLAADAVELDWRRAAGEALPASASAARPQLRHLRLRQARLKVEDAVFDLHLEARAQSGPAGHWQVQAQGRFREHPLRLHADLESLLPLLSPKAEQAPVPLVVTLGIGTTEARFKGRAASLLDARGLRGELWLSGPSLAAVGGPLGLTLPRTPAFLLHTLLREQDGVWTLSELDSTVGRSRLRGQMRYELGPTPPLLSGRLDSPLLQLDDLGPAVGVDRPRLQPGRLLPDQEFNLPTLSRMDADVQLRIERLHLHSAALAPLQHLQTRLQLRQGLLRLQELQAQIVGGRMRGSSALDSRLSPPRWQADLRFEDVELARWVRPLQGATGKPPILSGRLAVQARVEGRGASPAALLATLDGRISAQLQDGRMSHLATEALGLDLAQGLFVWMRGDDALPLSCARLEAEVREGLLRTRLAVLDSRDSRIELRGSVSLRDERLDLQARVQPKDISPLTLRSPVTIQGSWAAPQWHLDRGRVAGKLVAAAALGALVPVAAWLPLVDLGDGGRPAPCRAAS